MTDRQFYFISGLPRTGTTALCAVLSQNPDIYAGPNSPVCQLMWATRTSCLTTAREELLSSRRGDFRDELGGGIPHSFYRSVPERIIVDRCKAWMMPPNVDMIRRYITPDPKVIVMTRPVEEIVASLKEINRRNGRFLSDDEILTSPDQPLMRPLAGLEWATENNNGEYLFVEYADLVDQPADTVAGIYEFCGWEPFVHDFGNIVCHHPEDDSVHGLDGLHEVRPVMARAS